MASEKLETQIRTQAPFHLARLYEIASLENEPRLRVSKLVDLYEYVIQHLALVGLAEYLHRGLQDRQVEACRRDLERPSLGHWVALLRAVDNSLHIIGYDLLTPQVQTIFREGPIYEVCALIAPMAETNLPNKVRLSYFLDLLVQFRNKKFGHGNISEGEANQVVKVLEVGLSEWLAGLLVLQERHLMYIDHVEWLGEYFIYIGHNINKGTSIFPLDLKGNIPITPKRIYLSGKDENSNLTLLPLYPFFAWLYCKKPYFNKLKPAG